MKQVDRDAGAARGERVADGDRAAVHVGPGPIQSQLPLHGEVRVLRVLCLPERRGPAPEARTCYEELSVDDRGRRS